MTDPVAGALALAAAKAVAIRAAAVFSGAVGRRLERRSEEKALAGCLQVGFDKMCDDCGEILRRYDVNISFFELEAAGEVAKAFVPGSDIDPRILASLCATSLSSLLRDEERQLYEAELLGPFQVFVDAFLASVWEANTLVGLRRDKVIASAADGQASRATQTDEVQYLRWVIDKNCSIRTVGMVKTHAISVPLGDVFVDLVANRDERPGDRAKQWFNDERKHLEAALAAGQFDSVEFEARLDRLARRLAGRTVETETPDAVSIGDAISRCQHLLVIGDPGSGKTTLLRHMAMSAAAHRLDGRDSEPGNRSNRGRFPVFVRIGDFARSEQRSQGLSEFLATYAKSQDCDARGVRDLLRRRLEAGQCLVLLDGLDEVVSASDRQAVVNAIVSFVDAHTRAGNRFVVTSRISGYLAAPLPPSFEAYRVQPMDQATIERFLLAYCPAIESFMRRRPAQPSSAGRPNGRLRTCSTLSSTAPGSAVWPRTLCC